MKFKIPKVEFVCSWIYHRNWEEWIKLYPKAKKQPYPSWGEVIKYSKKIESRWRRVESKILKELSKVAGLKWKKQTIPCYLVGKCRSFSDPLTLHISYKTDNRFIDVLTHELIHQLFIQNLKETDKVWVYLRKKYSKESITTQNHIFLHAIHQNVLLKLFGKRRLNEDISWSKDFPDYKRSWEIVGKEGYKNVIKEFTSRVTK